MTEPITTDVLEGLFAGDGEMCALMRSHDWSQTPLGPVKQWPQSLRTTVSILLSTRHPMVLFWGPDLVQFYNDGYRPSLGAHKHPQALGQRGSDCWTEIWHIIGPQIHSVMTQGQETWHEDQLVPFDRNGYFEEIYFTYSYSPVRDETGKVGGTLVVCTETTGRVLSDRRLQTLRQLGANVMQAKTVEKACEIATDSLSINPYDIPFALLYLVETNGQQAKLISTTGIEKGTDKSPIQVNLTQNDVWGLAQVCQTGQAMLVDDLQTRFHNLPGGVWNTPPSAALVMPITQPGQQQALAGLLVMGISPCRAFDDEYRGFFDLVGNSIATAIANARTYEAERQRSQALAEIDRAKTDFFSNVSHEFRTPLTLILAPVEDALADTETPLSPKQRDRLETVQRNGLRLLKLVNTLLDFSRIEAGRVQAVYEPTDLARTTTELASTFRSLIERAGMSLVVECPPLPEEIYVDREMWEKIVLNLLSNAFKFTLSGTISVRLQSFGDRVELAIADTGIGIPPDEISHLFERFHRVKGAQGRSFEGSGIGLSLVEELVKLHGGSIHVTSQLAQGSCFTVSIPTGFAHLPSQRINASRTLTSTAIGATPYVEEAWRWLAKGADGGDEGDGGDREDEEVYLFTSSPSSSSSPSSPSSSSSPSSPSSPSSSSSPSSPSSPPAHILVVDDNADMRDYAKRLLGQRYQVEAVEDGMAALTAIRQRLPDLILTDMMMPRLDGFELLHKLRANPQTRELPIILLSARADEEARIQGLEAGADDYLTKPFSNRELLARVEVNLKMAQIRKQAALREQALRLVAETAQQEAKATFEKLNQILESMTDAFVALDQDWRIIYQNAAAELINNGKPRSQVLGKTHWEEWPASVGSALEHNYRQAMSLQVAVHFEHRYYSPPDYDVWLEIHAYPTKEGLGIFFRDITERKQAQAALLASQLQLQQQLAEIEAIYQSAPIGLNVLDANLRFIRINQRLAEINGLPVEAHIGRTVREVLPNLADAAEQVLRLILETGKPFLNVEITGETPAQPGVQRTWLEHFLPLKNGDEVIGISTVCEEITERKRIEAQRQQVEEELRQSKEELELRVAERTTELSQINADLQRSESTLRSFFNSGAMLMGIVEIHNNDILHISDNRAAAEFFGTTPEAMQNRFASDLGVPQQTIQEWVSYYRQAQEVQAAVRFEYPHDTPNAQRWLSVSVCPIAVSPTGYPRFSYIVEDISTQKQVKEHIEASLREKEVLLKEIHHRVKNNLGIVSSLLQMQSRRTIDAQANAILRDSYNRIASIALVHEKLYCSQDLANIDFAHYIRNLTAHLFTSYNTSSNLIQLSIDTEEVKLDIEAAVPCGLIINELVSNALKYAFCDNSAGQIKVKFYQENEHNLILIVQDNGIGLPENFDSKKSKTLGINLVQGLVKQLRGTIDINCQQGTEFRISFGKSRT
ncbi:response regulator receiver modulated diguanylate cyclase/phosphodiesterase with PAS/PAC sensor(s) [Nostoc sp. NIES-4103]|nr:response regulator receiver modulated diguanylate cyclase/phosphodiesterase with PAS/PAC sensor(s) [Nostoc sp. NIES-4103]